MTTLGIVWDPVYLDHHTDAGHPDQPGRLKLLYDRLAERVSLDQFVTIAPPPAGDVAILRVHSSAYLAQVKATAEKSAGALSADTLTCEHSFRVADRAAGGAIEAVRQVVAGRLDHALVLARPPGHHAERSRAMGYCIFNNVAIAAMAARAELGLARVMIVDWDLHHGNGTQHIFERDPHIFFFSSHQYPCYPGTGHFSETGLGPGEGTTMNVPLKRGFGDAEFLALYREILVPAAREFEPELIVVSAGFDIHTDDPLGGMRVTPAGFAGLGRLMMQIAGEVCRGRVVFCLEGGYDSGALCVSILSMIDELTDGTVTDVVALAAGADMARVRGVSRRCRHIHGRFWPTFAGLDNG